MKTLCLGRVDGKLRVLNIKTRKLGFFLGVWFIADLRNIEL